MHNRAKSSNLSINLTHQRGFTLVELMVATAVFAFAFSFIAIAFIEITKMYKQGIVTRRVQQNARFIIDDIVRSARPAQSFQVVSPSEIEIKYQEGIRLVAGKPVATEVSYCVVNTTDVDNDGQDDDILLRYEGNVANCAANGLNVLEPRVKVIDFDIQSIGATSAMVNLTIGSGDKEILTGDTCTLDAGRQFCAVTKVRASATARGGGNG